MLEMKKDGRKFESSIMPTQASTNVRILSKAHNAGGI